MDNKVLTIIVVALFIIILGDALIIGFGSIEKNDERLKAKMEEIKIRALAEIGESEKDAELSFVGFEIAPQSDETIEVYNLTVGGEKRRVWAKFNGEGAICYIIVEEEKENE